MSLASPGGQELLNTICDLGCLAQHFGLPKAQDVPACCAERGGVLTIPLDVPLDFGGPVSTVVTARELLEAMLEVASVPEVAIAKDHETMSLEHDIGTPRQLRDVETVAEPTAPKLAPKGALAARVRLRTGSSCCFRSALRGRTQSVEGGRSTSAVMFLHRDYQVSVPRSRGAAGTTDREPRREDRGARQDGFLTPNHPPSQEPRNSSSGSPWGAQARKSAFGRDLPVTINHCCYWRYLVPRDGIEPPTP